MAIQFSSESTVLRTWTLDRLSIRNETLLLLPILWQSLHYQFCRHRLCPIHFLICSVSMLVGANNRMRIPFGVAPSGNGRIPPCLTFLTDWYVLFRHLSSPFSLIGKGNGIFPLVLCQNRASSCTNLLANTVLSKSIECNFNFPICDRFLCIDFRISAFLPCLSPSSSTRVMALSSRSSERKRSDAIPKRSTKHPSDSDIAFTTISFILIFRLVVF